MSVLTCAVIANITAAALDCISTWRYVSPGFESNPLARRWFAAMGKGPALLSIFACITGYSLSWLLYSAMLPAAFAWLGVALLSAEALAHITGWFINTTRTCPAVLRPVLWATLRLFKIGMPRSQREWYAFIAEEARKQKVRQQTRALAAQEMIRQCSIQRYGGKRDS